MEHHAEVMAFPRFQPPSLALRKPHILFQTRSRRKSQNLHCLEPKHSFGFMPATKILPLDTKTSQSLLATCLLPLCIETVHFQLPQPPFALIVSQTRSCNPIDVRCRLCGEIPCPRPAHERQNVTCESSWSLLGTSWKRISFCYKRLTVAFRHGHMNVA